MSTWQLRIRVALRTRVDGELAERGDPAGPHREPEAAELVEDGDVGGWLAGVAAGEQPGAGLVNYVSNTPAQ
jgi:hypothetical protein